MSLRTIAIVRPRNPATGAVQVVRLGGGGLAPLYHDGQHYRAGIVRSPRFGSRLDVEDGRWTGGTIPTTAALVFAPPQAELLTELAGLYWPGASIELRAGPEDGVLSARLTGTVAEASVANGRLQLTIADLSAGVDKPVVTARFAGSGGVEGITEAAGRIKRRSWGRVFNVEGRILDKSNNIYEFGDPARPMQGFDALRDKGNSGSIVGLAWQGSIAATFAALQAAAAPAGGGVVAPSIACVKWWTQPSLLTADLRGETAGGYAEDVVGIAGRVLATVGGPAIANAVAASAWRPGAAGIHISDDNETAAQALDRLFLGASLLWVLDTTGAVNVREIGFAAPIETLRPVSSSRQRQMKPVRSYRVGYRRNQRQHNDGELATVLRGSDVAYSDNTPIDSLRPAESGANQTETRTAAAIAGQAATATSSDFAAVTGETKPEANATVGGAFGVNLRESLGGALALLNAFKTVLGIAASISGQGALATLNSADFASQVGGSAKPENNATVGAVFGSNLLETAGGAVALLSAFKTILGVASSISGQGSLATQNAASWATQVTGTGKPADNATVGAVFGSNLLETIGGTIALLSAFKTILGTAAGFSGQGALATKNFADWNSDIINRPTIGAGQDSLVFSGLPSGVIQRTVGVGETIALEASVNFNCSSSATRQARVEVAAAGGGYSTAVSGSALATGPGEPFTDSFSGSWTNTTGQKQAFYFRVSANVTSGLSVSQQSLCYLIVG